MSSATAASRSADGRLANTSKQILAKLAADNG